MIKPMLACNAPENLKFPLYATPKLDGIRVIINNGVLSRSLKMIPNKFVQKILSDRMLSMLDGEIIVGSANAKDVFQVTTSGIMTEEGDPDFTLWLFDYIPGVEDERVYSERYESLSKYQRELSKASFGRVKLLNQEIINSQADLNNYEKFCLDSGFEGVMLRNPNGLYKFGRSTEKQGYLMKLKRFVDSEAYLIGIDELMQNDNVATTNELGYTERSSHKANLTPKGTMGALRVKDVTTGIEFSIGTGFTTEQRQDIWNRREELIPPLGMLRKIVKYKSFPIGVKEAPRFPVFLGFRDKIDM
jgi:DNA ligase-1